MRAQPARRLGGQVHLAVRWPTGNFRPFLLFRDSRARGRRAINRDLAWPDVGGPAALGDSESPGRAGPAAARCFRFVPLAARVAARRGLPVVFPGP